jgi:basic membrane protein A
VYEAFKSAQANKWKGGIRNLGLKEDGVGYSLDEHNKSLITADMQKRLDQARADIIAGKIKVTDYTAKK